MLGDGGADTAPEQQQQLQQLDRVVRRERRAAGGRVVVSQLTVGPEEAEPTLIGQVCLASC